MNRLVGLKQAFSNLNLAHWHELIGLIVLSEYWGTSFREATMLFHINNDRYNLLFLSCLMKSDLQRFLTKTGNQLSSPDEMVCPGFSSYCFTEIDVPIDLRPTQNSCFLPSVASNLIHLYNINKGIALRTTRLHHRHILSY